MLNANQELRLRGAIIQLANTSEFRTLRHFFLAESGKEKPDQPGLKRFIMDLLSVKFDEEIAGAVNVRRQEAGVQTEGEPVKFLHPMR